MISQVVVVETLLNTSTSARCPAAPWTVPGMTRMSLVHGGVDTWVAVAVFEAEELALDAEEVVDGTDALGEAVLGVLDVLCAPDPEVALLHPASAAPAMNTNAVSCALLRIIGLSIARNPVDFVHVIVQETRRDPRNTAFRHVHEHLRSA